MKTQKGFTLIEISIVLIIIGIITGLILTSLNVFLKQSREKETLAKIETIKESILLYARTNSRLPCPSDPELEISNVNAITESNCAAAPAGGIIDTGAIRIGALPIRTLNLSPEHLYDGWHRKFTYVVTRNLSTTRANFLATPNGSISVKNESGISLTTPDNSAAFLIISHGSDNRGSYSGLDGGTKMPCNAAEGLDFDNCNDDNSFVETFYKNNGSNTDYDDILEWGVKSQISDVQPQYYGASFYYDGLVADAEIPLSPSFDTGYNGVPFVNSASNRIVIPAGVTKVRISLSSLIRVDTNRQGCAALSTILNSSAVAPALDWCGHGQHDQQYFFMSGVGTQQVTGGDVLYFVCNDDPGDECRITSIDFEVLECDIGCSHRKP